MRMKHAIRERWVEALRSGRYKKVSGKLGVKQPDGSVDNCALGVLCELAVLDGVTGRRAYSEYAMRAYSEDAMMSAMAYGGSLDTLPHSVQVWAGVTSGDPCVDSGDTTRTIAELNDASDLEFDEIAKLIDGDRGRKFDTED